MFRVWACVALVGLSATVVGPSARAEDDSAAEVKKNKDQMLALSKQTKAGTYFATAKVPADLDRSAYRAWKAPHPNKHGFAEKRPRKIVSPRKKYLPGGTIRLPRR